MRVLAADARVLGEMRVIVGQLRMTVFNHVGVMARPGAPGKEQSEHGNAAQGDERASKPAARA